MGCGCEVCHSADPHDKRLRTSALLTTDSGVRILMDCGPDFRQQYLTHNLSDFDGIIFTHIHFDHAFGINEIRPLKNADLYAERRVIEGLKRNFDYLFNHPYPGAPNLNIHEIDESVNFTIEGQEIIPVRAMHGNLPILGFRIGSFGYLTDVSSIDDSELEKFYGVKTFVLGALRKRPHPTHLKLEDAIAKAEKVNADRTFFVHMSHDMGLHSVVNEELPDKISLAYDGLEYEW